MFDNILAILTLVLGGGWLGQVLYLRYEKKKRSSELKSMDLDLKKKGYEISDDRLEKAFDSITQLQGIVDKERQRWAELAKELSEVKLELLKEREARKIAEYNMCTIWDCCKRQPPRIKNKQHGLDQRRE